MIKIISVIMSMEKKFYVMVTVLKKKRIMSKETKKTG